VKITKGVSRLLAPVIASRTVTQVLESEAFLYILLDLAVPRTLPAFVSPSCMPFSSMFAMLVVLMLLSRIWLAKRLKKLTTAPLVV